jgi:hypothetical protein
VLATINDPKKFVADEDFTSSRKYKISMYVFVYLVYSVYFGWFVELHCHDS